MDYFAGEFEENSAEAQEAQTRMQAFATNLQHVPKAVENQTQSYDTYNIFEPLLTRC